ncbi:hypothetical protein RB597_003146 [Gaeumannomyces tritici]
MRVVDKIVYYGKYQGTPETPHEINAIGFGYGLYPESDPIKVDHGFELLHELKASQAIGSKSFGFHLGIAGGLDSGAGSLTLGGYDRSRVIGQPAVFDALPLTDLAVFLVDVVVGVQVGDSPFELIAHPTSFFSSSALESSLSEERGGKSSSLLVQVDPQKPHMGLPTATCNSLARHLPVAWDSRLELTGKHVTIKIPPTQKRVTYFPCESLSTSHLIFSKFSPFYLGRAFLQENYGLRFTLWPYGF